MSLLQTDVPDLPAELRQLLQQIPPGSVSTYGDLARALGDVVAARWIGEYLADHPHDDDCNCHRVVRKGGDVGLYVSGDPADKLERLVAEGVAVNAFRVNKSVPAVSQFGCDAPLQVLRHQQEQLPQQIELCPAERNIRTVAGVDVSYVTPQWGVAAYARVDLKTQRVLWSTTVSGPVRFPYIPGYLTFRELPLYVRLFEKVRKEGQEAHVTLVDGNGILHPRRAGSASAAGVAVETATIGIGKKLLCGGVDLDDLPARAPREIIHEGEQIGVAMRNSLSSRPFFVSPGHRVDLATTIDVVTQSLGDGRLPLPITLADRLSRQVAQQIKASGEYYVNNRDAVREPSSL